MRTRTIIMYALAAIIVMVLGGLAGWYIVIKKETQTTRSQDQARGYDTGAPTADNGGASGGLGANTPNGGAFPGGAGTQSGAGSGGGLFSRMYNLLFGISSPGAQQTPSANFGGDLSQGNTATSDASSSTQLPPQLWRVSSAPIAGLHFLNVNNTTYLRYVERQSGYVVDANPATGAVVRRTNTLMPKIYEALIGRGDRIILRSIDPGGALATWSGTIGTSTASTTQPLKGASVGAGMQRAVLDEKTGDIVYVAQSTQGGTIMKVGADGTKPQTLLTSAISNWTLHPLADGRLIVSEAPADGIAGHAYELRSGSLAELLDARPGLTILPHASSSAFIFGTSRGTDIELFASITASTTAQKLPVRTIADKCVWAPSRAPVVYCAVPQGIIAGNFLDAWYRGAAHTNDIFESVDVSANAARTIYTPDSGPIDVMYPSIDPSGTYIAFVNAIDLSAYIFRISK